MALIGKIREKSWLLLIIVGGALLAFILGDWQRISGGNEPEYGLGTVSGEMVDFNDFNEMVAQAEDNAVRVAQQQQQPKQDVDKDQVWQSFTQNIVLQNEYQKLGIVVGQNEFDDYLFGTNGFTVMPDLAQTFVDPNTGMFSSSMLQQRIEDMKSDPEQEANWKQTEEYYKEKRQREKYFGLIAQGVYVSTLEAKADYMDKKQVKNISYVVKRFSEIRNDEIEVTDELLKAYFEKHKDEKKYENKVSSREVRYISVEVQPSGADSAAFNNKTEKLVEAFKKTNKDSVFVMNNSEVRMFVRQLAYRPVGDPKAQPNFTYPKELDSVFRNAAIGEVVGPYNQDGAVKIAKVLDKKGTLMTARHILISANRNDAEAVAKAKKTTDSLMAIINSDNFESLVTKHSQDPGSVQKGGKYEDFAEGEMVPEFNDYALNEPIGKIGYVQTDFGFHIMEPLGRKNASLPCLAVVQRTLKPSEETIKNTEDEAYSFLYDLNDKLETVSDDAQKVALFDTMAVERDLFARPVNIQDNMPRLYGFSTKLAEDKILALAFDADAQIGDVVSSPVKDGERYVVAILSSIKVKGETNFEDVKNIVKNDYIKDEKSKKFMAQMRSAKTLEELTKDGSSRVVDAAVTFGNPQITGAGLEPEVVGVIFSALKDGSLTSPIVGNQGVYVVKIKSTPEVEKATDYTAEQQQMQSAQQAQVQGSALKALMEQAQVVDNRRFYENRIRM